MTGDRCTLIGLIQQGTAGLVRDENRAGLTVLVGQVDDLGFFTLLRALAGDEGTANTNGQHRRLDRQGIVAGLGHGTRNKRERTLQHVDNGVAGIGRRVIDEIVQHHAGVFADGEGGVIDEAQTDRAIAVGLDDIILINGIAGFQLNARPVLSAGENGTLGIFDNANRLAEVSAILRQAFRTGTRQHIGQVARNHGTIERIEVRGLFRAKEIHDENFLAILPDQNQIRPLADKVRRQQKSATINDQTGFSRRIENSSKVCLTKSIRQAGR